MKKIRLFLLCWSWLFWGTSLPETWAFDDDRELHQVNFKKENFLDIQSYQFRKALEDEWRETLNGLRMSAGSLDLDWLYWLNELKIRQPLSPRLHVEYHLQKEDFYANKPFRQWLELEWNVWGAWSLSGFGFPAYDKRQADSGLALTWKPNPRNYWRVSRLEQDIFYNEKNPEPDFYHQAPVEDRIEGALSLCHCWQLRFAWLQDHPFRQFYPQDQLTLKHQGQEGKLEFDYWLKPHEVLGVQARGFDFYKSRQTPAESSLPSLNQTLQWLSWQAFWAQTSRTSRQWTLGMRGDRLRNLWRNVKEKEFSQDYHIETWQVYAMVWQPWGATMAWEGAIHLGHSLEAQDYLEPIRHDRESQSLEAKARLSWELRHEPNRGTWLVSSTWNLDDLTHDPWDGGQMSYQTRF